MKPDVAGAPAAPAAQLPGNVAVTRQDWLNVAMDLLVSEGVAEVKILSIGDRLGVSRSSFYWYFRSRKELLDELLTIWERTNTGSIVEHAAIPAETITAAVCNVFRCWWTGGSSTIDSTSRCASGRGGPGRSGVIDRSDAQRLEAIRAMFERHGFPPEEAEVRARILYYMQIGYYALELAEPLEERLARVGNYLLGFTGQPPRPGEVEAFTAYAREVAAS